MINTSKKSQKYSESFNEISGPNWIEDGIRLTSRQIIFFFQTAFEFTIHPIRFTEEWVNQERRAINPFGFLATSVAILGPIRSLCLWILGIDQSADSLWIDLLNSLGPFVHYAALGVLCHLTLSIILGSKRKASDSVALAIYAGGGPAAAAELLVWIILVVIQLVYRDESLTRLFLYLGLGIAFSIFCAAFASSLGVLHRVRWWHIFITYAIAFVSTGLFFGIVDPPGNYGMHWVIKLFNEQGVFSPHLGLGL